jgi:transposase-like protein
MNIQKKEMETVGGESGMKCPDCNSEMEIDKECGYMKQYRCDVCRRVETLWTVCITA